MNHFGRSGSGSIILPIFKLIECTGHSRGLILMFGVTGRGWVDYGLVSSVSAIGRKEEGGSVSGGSKGRR